MVQFLSTSNLDIYVKFENAEEGSLKDIEVTLTPYRQGPTQ
jgi:hypothetical protein